MIRAILKVHTGWKRLVRRVRGQVVLAASGFNVSGRVHIAVPLRLRATDGAVCNVGADVSFERLVDVTVKRGQLVIGARTFIGQGTIIVARQSITIGVDCLIAEYVTIRDQDHRFGGGEVTARNGFETAPIVIGNNVWIGAKATITKGVTIGDNSVIGANSLVASDIPADCVAAGVPARVIRRIGDGPLESSPGHL